MPKNKIEFFFYSLAPSLINHFHSNESKSAHEHEYCLAVDVFIFVVVAADEFLKCVGHAQVATDEEVVRNQTIKYFDIKKKEILKTQEERMSERERKWEGV